MFYHLIIYCICKHMSNWWYCVLPSNTRQKLWSVILTGIGTLSDIIDIVTYSESDKVQWRNNNVIYYTILVATMLVATMCRKLTDYHVITDVTTDDNTAGAFCVILQWMMELIIIYRIAGKFVGGKVWWIWRIVHDSPN